MPETKVALITGVNGQDGSWMAELLVGKGYEVHGMMRRRSTPNLDNIRSLFDEGAITIHEGDLGSPTSLEGIIRSVVPDEVYHLGSQSHVGTSFQQPEYTMDVTGLGPLRLFEVIRQHCPVARVYQASSSEMFGNTGQLLALCRGPEVGWKGLCESDPFAPVSPYGVAKVAAHNMAKVYRDAYELFIASGILFNHESVHRSPAFVTRKITRGLSRVKHGLQESLVLGNLNAVRDWGHAPEYMEAAWRMLQQDEPTEFVVATGEGRTVREFLDAAWREAKLEGDQERVVVVHEAEKRPTDIEWLVGDAGKAKGVLGWEAKTKFDDLVRIMMQHDLQLAEREAQHAARRGGEK